MVYANHNWYIDFQILITQVDSSLNITTILHQLERLMSGEFLIAKQ